MSEHRRNYSELTSRQKRRRRQEAFSLKPLKMSKLLTESLITDPSDTAAFDKCIPTEGEFGIHIGEAWKKSEQSTPDNFGMHSTISEEEKIQKVILEWSVQDKTVSDSSIARLLKKFREYYPSIPKCPATLRGKSFAQIRYTAMSNGTYAHFPEWPENICSYLESSAFKGEEVEIILNVDGIPLYENSRQHHAYPILVLPVWQPNKIFVAGLYVSETPETNKMPPVKQFLEQFAENLELLLNDGINVGGVKVNVSLCAIVCDSPARAELKGIVGHSGYNSCERCIQKGRYVNGHVVLEKTDAPLRNNQSFIREEDASHHKLMVKESPFYPLGVDFVREFPLDYMHLVCLGVMRRLIMRWKSSKQKEIKRHLSVNATILFNHHVQEISQSLPSEFKRRLQGGLSAVKFWKATEFRTFLLYVGFLILRKTAIFPVEVYSHFLKLAVSMRFLLMDDQITNVPLVQDMLIDFVTNCSTLYGTTFLSYNVHSLIHLTQDYMKFGNLNNVSAFIFESFLGTQIKGCLRGKFKPIKQISKYVTVLNSKNPSCPEKKQTDDICLGPVSKQAPVGIPLSYKSVHWSGKILKCGNLGDRDSGISLKNEKIGIIKSIHKDYICVQVFKEESDLFESPCQSSLVGIKKVKGLAKNMQCIRYDELKTKAFIHVQKNSCISMELLH